MFFIHQRLSISMIIVTTLVFTIMVSTYSFVYGARSNCDFIQCRILYYNPNLSLRMQIPSDWIVDPDLTKSLTFSTHFHPSQFFDHESITIRAFKPGNVLMMESFTNLLKHLSYSNASKSNTFKIMNTTIGGSPALETQLTFIISPTVHARDTIQPVIDKRLYIFTIHNGTGYLIDYDADQTSYSRNLPLVQKLLKTIEFTPQNPGNYLVHKNSVAGTIIFYPREWELFDQAGSFCSQYQVISKPENNTLYPNPFAIKIDSRLFNILDVPFANVTSHIVKSLGNSVMEANTTKLNNSPYIEAYKIATKDPLDVGSNGRNVLILAHNDHMLYTISYNESKLLKDNEIASTLKTIMDSIIVNNPNQPCVNLE